MLAPLPSSSSGIQRVALGPTLPCRCINPSPPLYDDQYAMLQLDEDFTMIVTVHFSSVALRRISPFAMHETTPGEATHGVFSSNAPGVRLLPALTG